MHRRGRSATASAVLTINPVPQTVTTLASKSGGGGSVDLTSILALAALACLVRLRKLRFAVVSAALALSVASLSAHADEEFAFDWQHSYLGLRAGQSSYKYSASILDAALGESSEVTNTSTISKDQFGGALYAGVPLFRQLTIEAGYVQMGQFPLSIRTNSADLASTASTKTITATCCSGRDNWNIGLDADLKASWLRVQRTSRFARGPRKTADRWVLPSPTKS